MKLFKQILNTATIPKWIPIAILVLALIGFADATYLTIEHYKNVIPPCSTSGCESVLNSSYSKIFGIPTSLLGSIYYLFIGIMLIIYFDTKKEIFLRISFLCSIFGFIFSLFFVYLMIFVIKFICTYCVLSATSSTIIFLISYWSLYSLPKVQE